MDLLLIACICSNNSTNIDGYRILDPNEGKTIDVPTNSLVSAIKAKKVKLINARIQGRGIVGTNGSLDRYTKCTRDNSLVFPELNTIVIINRIGTIGFTICDYKGTIKTVSDDEAIAIAKSHGIANGKIVTQENVTFISAINGTYDVIPAPDNKVQKPITESNVQAQESVFTQEQKLALKEYYYLITDNNREKINEYKTEINGLETILKANKLDENYLKYSKYIYIVSLLNDVDTIKRLIDNGVGLCTVRFLSVGLPIPESMALRINSSYSNKTFDFISEIFGDTNNFKKELENNGYGFEDFCKEALVKINKSKEHPGSQSLIHDIYKYVVTAQFIGMAGKLMDEQITNANLTLATVINYFINSTETKENKYENTLIALALRRLQRINNNTTDLKYDFGFSIYDAAQVCIKNNNAKIIEGFLNKCVTDALIYGTTSSVQTNKVEETTNESSSLEQLFNKAYEENHSSDETSDVNFEELLSNNEIIDEPVELVSQTTQSVETVNNDEKSTEEYTSRPDGFSVYKWLQWLYDHNTYPENDISIVISKDIMSRKIKFSTLSSKQLYRINSAIRIMENINKKRLGVIVEETETEDKYLSDHTELRDNINRIISLANSVEMKAVIDEHPHILGICYTALKNNKVTPRQLKHINAAIKILDNQ